MHCGLPYHTVSGVITGMLTRKAQQRTELLKKSTLNLTLFIVLIQHLFISGKTLFVSEKNYLPEFCLHLPASGTKNIAGPRENVIPPPQKLPASSIPGSMRRSAGPSRKFDSY
jgi:hypothetical protein